MNSLRAWNRVEVYLVSGAVSESLTNEDHIEAMAISGSQPPDQQHFSAPWFIASAFTSPQYVTFWSATFYHPVCFKFKPYAHLHHPLIRSIQSHLNSLTFSWVHTITMDVKGFGSIEEALFKSIWIECSTAPKAERYSHWLEIIRWSVFPFRLMIKQPIWIRSSAQYLARDSRLELFQRIEYVWCPKYKDGPNWGCLLEQ